MFQSPPTSYGFPVPPGGSQSFPGHQQAAVWRKGHAAREVQLRGATATCDWRSGHETWRQNGVKTTRKPWENGHSWDLP